MDAVFFDMDGLLLDTEDLIIRLSMQLGEERGIAVTREEYLEVIGMSEENSAQVLAHYFREDYTYCDMDNERRERMKKIIELEGLPVKKGAAELLKYLKGQGVKIGLVTSTIYKSAEALLKTGGLYDYFDGLTTGDQVKKSKPNPDIYLLAAKRFGVDPQNAWALEDSYNGLRAAKAAGMNTIMVPDLKPYSLEIAPFVDKHFASLDKALPFFKTQLKGPGSPLI